MGGGKASRQKILPHKSVDLKGRKEARGKKKPKKVAEAMSVQANLKVEIRRKTISVDSKKAGDRLCHPFDGGPPTNEEEDAWRKERGTQ